MLHTYSVRPHREGGYALSGPLLPHALRYLDETDAVSYAHHMLRETGGRVLILDAHGCWQFTEHAQAHDSGLRVLNEFRASAT
jgi:hypothetical protein